MNVMSYGPFDLTGGPFLILYVVLLVAAIIAAVMIPRRMRLAGQQHNITDPDQIAYLAGGKARFVDAVVARMLATGTLVMATKTKFAGGSPSASPSMAERSVLALSAPFGWGALQGALRTHVPQVERALQANGLLMADDDMSNIRWSATLPYVLLIGFGAIKWLIGEMRERPTGFLTALLIVTLVLAVIRWFSIDRRTAAGHHAVADAKLRNQRLNIAPIQSEIPMAVALFGTTVLAGSAWADFHKMRQASSGDGGSGGSDGDGGCGGGGGCGGCGS
jgi:uncharacterized protein (TIGR04222 family)